jgi:hypothetical protein
MAGGSRAPVSGFISGRCRRRSPADARAADPAETRLQDVDRGNRVGTASSISPWCADRTSSTALAPWRTPPRTACLGGARPWRTTTPHRHRFTKRFLRTCLGDRRADAAERILGDGPLGCSAMRSKITTRLASLGCSLPKAARQRVHPVWSEHRAGS